MNIKDILAKIAATDSPLARQMLMTGLITRRLADKGKPPPVLIGGLALSYYTRDVYFTADIDLAYADREALGEVLSELGFAARGRYWVHPEADVAVEVPASGLAGVKRAPASSLEMLLLRDRLGLKRYRKTARRDPEKKKILLELALKRIMKAERSDYIPLGFRKRRVRFAG